MKKHKISLSKVALTLFFTAVTMTVAFAGCGNSLLGLHDYLFGDKSVLISGDFTTIDSVSHNFLGKIKIDASVTDDLNIQFGGGATSITALHVTAEKDIYVGGNFTQIRTDTTIKYVAKLDQNGNIDSAFSGIGLNGQVNSITTDSKGRVYLSGTFIAPPQTSFLRLNSDGSWDSSFPNILGMVTINAIAVLSKGKIVVGGSLGGPPFHVLLNPDGSYANNITDAKIDVHDIKVLDDDSYLLVEGNAGSPFIEKHRPDGTLDPSFNNSITIAGMAVYGVDIDNEGNIYICGDFTNVDGHASTNFVRLNKDGIVDTSFVCQVNSPGAAIRDLVVDGDHIYIGGSFAQVAGLSINNFAVVDENGVPDMNFTYTFDNIVSNLALLPEADLP